MVRKFSRTPYKVVANEQSRSQDISLPQKEPGADLGS